MRLNFTKLRGNEIEQFSKLRNKYKNYDRLDLLLHKTLKSLGCSIEEYRCRKEKEKEKLEVIIQNEADELNKFCDGSSCEFDPTKLGNC